MKKLPKLTKDSVKELTDRELLGFLEEEVCEDAVFAFVTTISLFGIDNLDDAALVMGRDPAVRDWAEMSAIMIPEPYVRNMRGESDE